MRIFTLLILLSLVGCSGGEHSDLREWMKTSSKDLRGGIPKLPPVIPYTPVAYQSEGRPDPFSSSKLEPDTKLRGGGKAGGLQPNFEARELRNNVLERFPLETIKMIGFMRINNAPLAVVQVEQHVKQVRVGDYIGQDFGVIVQISENEVVLRELVQDSTGDWSERTSALQLQQAKEEGKK